MPGSVARQVFEPMRVDYDSPEVGGGGSAVSAGPARWAAKYTLGTTSQRQVDAWRAFLASLRGTQKLFFGKDWSRRLPAFYAGGLPSGWNGDLASWTHAVSGGDATLSVTGLPSGMGIAAGDYVGLRWTTGGFPRFALVRAVQDVASTAGAASFPVEPALPTFVPADAVAYMKDAGCLMRQDTSQQAVAEMGRAGRIDGTVFAGRQVLLP